MALGGTPGSGSAPFSAPSIPWWGYVAAIVVVLWAADSGTWGPVVVMALVALVLVNFDKVLKG